MASPDVLPLSSFHRLGLEAHLLRSIMSTVSSTLTSMLTDALEGGAGGGAGKAIRDVAQEVGWGCLQRRVPRRLTFRMMA
jgi:hypothetical protein